jgi:PhnB protein
MTRLNPYLTLAGRCREALDFYQQCLGGEVVALMTHADANMEVPQGYEHYIVHAEFRSGDLCLMLSDGIPGRETVNGNRVQLCLSFEDPSEQTRVFDALAEEGKITMVLHDAFWGDRFGMLTDRFGFQWMLNCPPVQARP